MAARILISNREIELASTKYNTLVLQGKAKPSVYGIFKSMGLSQAPIKRWVESVGGIAHAHQKLAVNEDDIKMLYNKTVKEIERRIEGGIIGDRELLELMKLLTGIQENTGPSVQVNIATSIDSFLKENAIDVKTE